MGESTHSKISRRRVAIIGAGNVAWHLAPAIAKHHQPVAIYSRTRKSAEALAEHVGVALTQCDVRAIADVITPADADIYIIASTDTAINDIGRLMVPKTAHDALWLHTSGSVGINAFDNLTKRCGVMYPLQTFSKGATVDFSKVPLLLEAGNDDTRAELCDFAATLSDNVHYADSATRRKVHIAAVFACNFSNCMWRIAARQLASSNIPFDILLPLLHTTVDKLSELSPAEAQTGPASRHDIDVVNSHIRSLSGDEKEIYQLISKYIMEHSPGDTGAIQK